MASRSRRRCIYSTTSPARPSGVR
uniref:Uncharacterized protein n=1 Tax=Arundo donax TaxID=35708 RepID=A0A0A8YG14_ARUDO